MTASFASLRKRVEKLRGELRDHKIRRAIHTGTVDLHYPPVAKWPEFASRTWIRTSGTVAPFVPYAYQRDLVEKINANPNTIILKSRQTGISETICSYLLCRALTEPGFAAVVFSKTQQDSSSLGKRVRAMANSIRGGELRYLTDSNTEIAFEGLGTIFFLPASARAARGIPSCSVLFLDEAAFLESAAEIYQGAMPTLSMVGEAAKVIIASTPGDELDWYGQMWHSQDEDTPWTRVQIHWSQHPVYSKDPKWAEKTRRSRKMTMAAWNQEYELQFGVSDSQVYPPALVRASAKSALEECGHVNRSYVVAIDPNAGGNDYFVTLVLDVTSTPYKVVGMYRENGRSTDYSLKNTKAIIEDFDPVRVIVEKQAMGSVIAEALQQVLPKYAIETFSTSRPSKTTATDRILYYLERGELWIPPGVMVDELCAFHQKDSGAREAASGYHDDTVMALAFAVSLIPENAESGLMFNGGLI